MVDVYDAYDVEKLERGRHLPVVTMYDHADVTMVTIAHIAINPYDYLWTRSLHLFEVSLN